MLARLTLVVLLYLASPAAAVTYTDAESTWSDSRILLLASDGFTEQIDQVITPSTGDSVGDVFVEETGTVGVIEPLRVFSGHIRQAPADLTWDGVPGSVSGVAASITFDEFEVEFESTQIGLASVSGSSYSDPEFLTGVLRASGSVLFGSRTIPVTYSTTAEVRFGSVTRESNGTTIMEWRATIDSLRFPLFAFTEGGVSYEGVFIGSSTTMVPEPSTALLVGLGLAGLASRQGRRR